MQFYSNSGYAALREFFGRRLPKYRTIQRWLRCVDASPGILQTSLDVISEKAKSYKDQGKQLDVCLLSDEMSIMKHAPWKREKNDFEGFCSSTNSMHENQNQNLPVAKEALFFMIVGPDFRIPVAYFLLRGLQAIDRSALTLEVVKSVDATGCKIVSFTFDALNANIATAKLLGADFKNEKPFFPRPSNPEERIYIILDPPHMLKLVRRCFASSKLCHDGDRLR